MKILHVVRQFAPAIGGLESYVKELCLEHQKLGHEVALMTLNKVFHSAEHQNLPAEESIDGIRIHRVSFVGKRRFFVPFLDTKFLRQFDVIHVHNTDGLFDSIALLRPFIGKPLFATSHGGFFHTQDFSAFKTLYFNLITRLTIRAYRKMFAISQNDYDTFAKLLPKKRLVLQPNAIKPLGDFISTGSDFLYIGRLAKHKRVERLIDALAALKQHHGSTARLHIIGPEWDVTKDSLRQHAQRLGVEDQLVLHGFISPEKMQQVLRECGYFFSASEFEGFGMSMLEGMSVGLIPFVQPNASFKELVAQGGLGSCANFIADSEQAAAEIAEKLGSYTEADRLAAQKFARSFAWDALAKTAIGYYEAAGAGA